MQQPYWNTIRLEGFEDEVLETMIVEAYEEVVLKLTKKEKTRHSNICSFRFKTSLCVDESCQGQGLAKELLRRLDSEAQQQGYRFIEVDLSACSPVIPWILRKMLYKETEEKNKYIRKL